MSTTTTNYGFTKMDPGEPASVAIWNANLDAIDTEIKTTRDVTDPNRWAAASAVLTNNINFLTSSPTHTKLTGFSPLFGDDNYESGSTISGTPPVETDSGGNIVFNHAGIYLVHLSINVFGYSTSITESMISTAIIRDSDNVVMKEHRTILEAFNANTILNSTWLVKVGTGGDLATGTTYKLGVAQQNSLGGSATIAGATTTYMVELVKE